MKIILVIAAGVLLQIALFFLITTSGNDTDPDYGSKWIYPLESQHLLTRVDSSLVSDDPLFAEFKGQIKVTGKLEAQWVVDLETESNLVLDIRLQPDEKSINILPHISGYPVNYIYLENEKEAVRLAMGKKMFINLEQQKIKILKAEGSFLIEHFMVGVECDTTKARAKLVNAHVIKPLTLAGEKANQYGC